MIPQFQNLSVGSNQPQQNLNNVQPAQQVQQQPARRTGTNGLIWQIQETGEC